MEEAWELAAVSSKSEVFLSWSGDYARKVALAFSEWLPLVIHGVRTFHSSEGIEVGSKWNSILSSELSEMDFGVLFITSENCDAPWINFEAGALSKNVEESRVIPVLIDPENIDLARSPLRQFQNVKLDKEGFSRIVVGVYSSMNSPSLSAELVSRSFNHWWPQLDEMLSAIGPYEAGKPIKKPTEDDRLAALTEEVRYLADLIGRRQPRSPHDLVAKVTNLNELLARATNPIAADIIHDFSELKFAEFLNVVRQKYNMKQVEVLANDILPKNLLNLTQVGKWDVQEAVEERVLSFHKVSEDST